MSRRNAPLDRLIRCFTAGGAPTLTADEERALFELARSGDPTAVHRLVISNLGFVARVAFHYRTRGVPVEDLFNEGALGLIEAVDRFEPQRGHRFLTYAVHWIRKSILSAIALHSHVVRVPASRRRDAAQVLSPVELTVRAKAKPPEALSAAQAAARRQPPESRGHVSFDLTLGESDRLSLGETLHDPSDVGLEQRLIARETKRALASGMAFLTGQEREVLRLRFGLTDGQDRTLEQVGRELGITRERVRQVERNAKAKLLKNLKRRQRIRWARRGETSALSERTGRGRRPAREAPRNRGPASAP